MTIGGTASSTVLLAGGGKMGTALLEGWLGQGGVKRDFLVIEPAPSNPLETLIDAFEDRVTFASTAENIPPDLTPEAVVFAVKPQIMAEVVPQYAGFGEPLFLSIAAGTTIANLTSWLGDGRRIIRAMPNTPAAIGRGMTVLCPNAAVRARDRAIAEGLLEAAGKVAWIEDEADMDAVVAVSGSGPAYVFLLIECMTNAGIELGLEPDFAALLARETVAGAGELASIGNLSAETLRKNVSSAGGTTVAALDVLMKQDGQGNGPHALQQLFSDALRAAAERSKELGS